MALREVREQTENSVQTPNTPGTGASVLRFLEQFAHQFSTQEVADDAVNAARNVRGRAQKIAEKPRINNS